MPTIIPEEMIERIARDYPSARIVRIPEQDPTEVVFEISRKINGTESIALVLMGESKPHFHEQTWETYEVLIGELKLFVTPGYLPPPPNILTVGRTATIEPKMDHWAQCVGGIPALIKVTSKPAWNVKDHHLAGK